MRLGKMCIIFLVVIVFLSDSFAFACNSCHSKNPKMVKMHKELGFQNCFECHGSGKIKPKEEQQNQMENDKLCIKCHCEESA